MITAHVVGDAIVSSTQDAFSLFEKSCFGEKKRNRIEYAPIEVIFLVETERMEVFSGKKKLNEDYLFKKFKKTDKKLETKYVVFHDLRKKGYIVKTALKFGAEFRVYEKGVKPGDDHAKWVLYSVKESDQLNWYDFAAKNRVAHSTQKHLLLGVVDNEGDVSYYEVGWVRP